MSQRYDPYSRRPANPPPFSSTSRFHSRPRPRGPIQALWVRAPSRPDPCTPPAPPPECWICHQTIDREFQPAIVHNSTTCPGIYHLTCLQGWHRIYNGQDLEPTCPNCNVEMVDTIAPGGRWGSYPPVPANTGTSTTIGTGSGAVFGTGSVVSGILDPALFSSSENTLQSGTANSGTFDPALTFEDPLTTEPGPELRGDAAQLEFDPTDPNVDWSAIMAMKLDPSSSTAVANASPSPSLPVLPSLPSPSPSNIDPALLDPAQLDLSAFDPSFFLDGPSSPVRKPSTPSSARGQTSSRGSTSRLGGGTGNLTPRGDASRRSSRYSSRSRSSGDSFMDGFVDIDGDEVDGLDELFE